MQEIENLQIAEKSQQEAGNHQYEYVLPVDEPDTVYLFEIWDSEEVQKKHMETAHFAHLGDLKKKYVSDVQIIKK